MSSPISKKGAQDEPLNRSLHLVRPGEINLKKMFNHDFLGSLIVTLILYLILLFAVVALIQKVYRDFTNKIETYDLKTLKAHRLAGDDTIVRKKWLYWGPIEIYKPLTHIEDYRANILLLSTLYPDLNIYDVSEIGRHKFSLIEAPKNVKFDLFKIINNQIGFALNSKALTLKAASVLVQVGSGSGKSILANNLIYFSLKSNKNRKFKIILVDSHGSYRALKNHSNIDLYELEEANEKLRLKATLESILTQQAATQISIRYETVQEAQNAGEMLDIEICLILIDEFAENFSGKEKINSEILELLTKLTTSVRKYGNRLVIMTQAQIASDQLIHSNKFNAVIFSKLSEELAIAKGIKTATSPILKNPGTFYLESKFDESTFFKTAFISKAELLKLLGEI
jgi:hypothetical protein